MKIKIFNPNYTLVEVIMNGYLNKKDINSILLSVNKWQKERMDAETELFGTPLTREINEDELRKAISYLRKRKVI